MGNVSFFFSSPDRVWDLAEYSKRNLFSTHFEKSSHYVIQNVSDDLLLNK